MVRDADRGCPPRASPLADQTLRLGRLGGRPGTFDSVCRRVVLDIRGRVRTGVGVGWCFDEARPHARHKRAYESEHLGPGAEPAKHNDSSVRVAFRPVNPVPTRGPAVASPGDPATGNRPSSRHGRSRSACVANGRLRQAGKDPFQHAPPCVVSRVGFYVLQTSRAYASAVRRTRRAEKAVDCPCQ